MIRAALVAVALTACAAQPKYAPLPDPPPQPIEDNQIVPGVRIGMIALGMQGASVLQMLGQPEDSQPTMRMYSSGCVEGQCATTISLTEDNRVTAVYTSMVGAVTDSGVGPGVSSMQVSVAYGQPQWEQAPVNFTAGGVAIMQRHYKYDVGLEITEWNGNVKSVGVTRARVP